MNTRITSKWSTFSRVLTKGKKILRNNKSITNDKFIIKFTQHKSSNINIGIDPVIMDIRRAVFVSLIDLYRSWRKYDSHILYSAILIVPLQKKWILNATKYHNELCTTINVPTKQTSEQYIEFLELLKWKDSQQLIFYMLDEYKYPKYVQKTERIAPFWYHLSNKLVNLYDPVTGKKYNPLQLDAIWWQRTDFECKFVTNKSSEAVLDELYYLTMKFKSIQEIIYESNPRSLKPIKYYGESEWNENTDFVKHIITVNQQEQEWYISSDYF